VVYLTTVTLVSYISVILILTLQGSLVQSVLTSLILRAVLLSLLLFLPLSIGIAILRTRLWDIDIVIRRTLVYTLFTATLALVYFGSVVLLQTLLRGLTGEGQNQFVTVLSTLALAALFTPLRRRVQDGIDRRFYRRKYNAEQVLTTFSKMVRTETDLNRLSAELVRVVGETMQPTQVSLRLRKSEAAIYERRFLP
jgi:amino acid transporter